MLRYLIIIYHIAGALATRKNIDISSDDGKILGGREFDITQAPYVAGLLYHGQQFCGGAIIDPEYVLTTAHCVIDKQQSGLMVHIGSKYREHGGQKIRVREIQIHPEYDNENNVNDIALLKLQAPITLNESAKKIKLGNMPLSTRASISVSGWGRNGFNNSVSSVLRGTTLKVVNQKLCKQLLLGKHLVPRTVFCASDPQGERDTCAGDSGGPAIHQDMLVGLTAWGEGCGDPNTPGVYTRVSSFIDWIRKVTHLEL